MNAWQGRELTSTALSFSTEREALIRKVLAKGKTLSDLRLWFRFVWESDTHTARWLRGQERGSAKSYLSLANLLVMKDGKLDDRIEEARLWLAGEHDEHQPPVVAVTNTEEVGDPLNGTGVDLGWQAMMPMMAPAARPGAPGTRPVSPKAQALTEVVTVPVRRPLHQRRRLPRVPVRGGGLED